MSKEQNITEADNFFRGEDKQLVFDVVDANGDPQTMTGWALGFNVYRFDAQIAAILTYTTASEIAIGNGDGTDDRATVTIPDTATDPLIAGVYRYELLRTDAGSEQVLAYGDLVLRSTRNR